MTYRPSKRGARHEFIKHSHEECLRIAKEVDNPDKRRWLLIGQANMYGNPDSFVKVYVLEGTPPRGYIIETYEQVARVAEGKVDRMHEVHLRSERNTCLCGKLPRKVGK
jgi:hypothetical protein